ncbi:MAG: ROK family protein [Candidatus Omnitrophica bacterium]|nr:ROK family protein [Candidatus Omnitrophota bacterium]
MIKKYIIAIDLGGTNLKIAVLNLNLNILRKEIIATRTFRTKVSLIESIVDSVNAIIARYHLKKRDVLGIGLGVPGPVDHKSGVVHFFPNIPGWKEVKLRDILQRKVGLPVTLDNDAKAMALAEYTLGRAKNASNALCITLGTGVGGGIIIGKKIYRGKNNAAGEIGHLPINENGPRCNCGGLACLEAYIGNKRILKQARKIFQRKISLEELSLLAKQKHRKAVRIWKEIGRHLGVALSAVINLMNPDVIVIGGGVANSGKVLFSAVRETIKERAMSLQARQVKVLKAKLGSDAGLFGAAIMLKQERALR